MNLSVASSGASLAIQGQCETWSCNREFESFSSIDFLNGKAGSKYVLTDGADGKTNGHFLLRESDL